MQNGYYAEHILEEQMWAYDSIYAKAITYFERAQNHSSSTGDEFLIWNLLGLEFLLRAPLAKIHPSRLAAPEGDALLHATGVKLSSELNLKSVTAQTILKRLPHIISDFNDERVSDANILLNMRNAELHTGSSIATSTKRQFWLPKLIRVADVITVHLGVSLQDLLGQEVVAEGRSLVDAEDKKLIHDVKLRIQIAKDFYGKLSKSEITSRQANISGTDPWLKTDNCPACGTEIGVSCEEVRVTSERVEGDEVVSKVIYVVLGLECPICSLQLNSTAEINAAGLDQQFEDEIRESIERLFLDASFDDGEYGND